MKKTIRIDNLYDVFAGDRVVVSGLPEASFEVAEVSLDSDGYRLRLYSPFSDCYACLDDERFDHAERTVVEPEWPNPTDTDMHVYQGADGAKYLYLPSFNCDSAPWHRLPIGGCDRWDDADGMISSYPAALPLIELKLVPKEEEA